MLLFIKVCKLEYLVCCIEIGRNGLLVIDFRHLFTWRDKMKPSAGGEAQYYQYSQCCTTIRNVSSLVDDLM